MTLKKSNKVDWKKILVEATGWSVAHEAAYNGTLPPDFNKWEIATYSGWSVAHVAAKKGQLPDNFDKWDLIDDHCQTVRYLFEKYKEELSNPKKDLDTRNSNHIWKGYSRYSGKRWKRN